ETITKWNTQVRIPEIVPEVVRKAFKLAQTEKPGATHIELPEDVAAAEAEGKPLLVQQPYPTEPLAGQVDRAVEIISEAERPMVLAGNGVARAGASRALTEFASTLNLPVATTFMGKGAIPYTDSHSLLTVGLQARDYVACGLDRADCVITVGYDLVEYSPDRWNPDRDKQIVHIDMSPAEVDKSYIVSVGVLGDLSVTLREIAGRARPSQDTYTARLRRMILDELEAYRDDRAFPIKPQRIMSDLRAVLDPEDIVISDVGAHKMWVARMYPCERPNTAIISNGFASMGIALPGAVAAKLAFPERKVVAVVGDGGFLMNVQELETAVREGLSFAVLVFTDGGYGLIGWKQELKFGRPAYVEFGNPDFLKLAESFGCAGYRVEAPGELAEILAEATGLDRPAVIDCPVDYRENLKLTEKLGQLVCPI
ncbi:MAG: acetolactate synthase large subunit, partial [Acidobacteriota bacterium]